MSKIRLIHLTMTGPDRPAASVEFGENLTAIYGASDTGKSYLAGAIDFMLGGTRLKDIPQADGYDQILLGMTLPESGTVTLGRRPSGGPFSVWSGDLRANLPAVPRVLKAKHDKDRTDNLSRFLLAEVGLDGRRIRTNAKGRNRKISFRDVARLCLVGEADILHERSPVLSGQYTLATAEREVFLLMTEGREEGNLQADWSPSDRTLSRGKAELLSSLIANLEARMSSPESVTSLAERLDRIDRALEEAGASHAILVQQREQRVSEEGEIRRQIVRNQETRSDLRSLRERFLLLVQKYASDLDRLDMIGEAGNLLGFFERGNCPFCGTALEDQPDDASHVEAEASEFAASVAAEREKTRALSDDLLNTLSDVDLQLATLDSTIASLTSDARGAREAIESLDEQLAPRFVALEELISARSAVEVALNIREQIEDLEDRRAVFLGDGDSAAAISARPASAALGSLADTVRTVLEAWGVPSADSVEFDPESLDLVIEGRPRSERGKGMRSILHAGFTVGLAQYCLDNDLPHPGLVVLDSPLLTFRPPDEVSDELDEADEPVTASVAEAFFRYLATDFLGQAVVLENTDPPALRGEAVSLIRFSGTHGLGRFGFFPT